MAQPPQQFITDEEKTGLLFNRFNNVADTRQGLPYSFQPYLALDAIKAEGVLSEAIPTSLPANFTVAAMDQAADAANWPTGTTYNLGTGASLTPGGSAQYSMSLGTVTGATMVEFVYKLQLHECTNSGEQAFTHPPTYANDPSQGPSTLQNTIPFKQDAGPNDSYNYRVFAVTNTTAGAAGWILIPKSDPGTLYILDTKTGILQFMAPSDINNLKEPSREISQGNPPAISFHRYVGATGVGSGNQSWGDASFNNVDISGQLKVYNDASMTTATIKDLTVAYNLNTANSFTNYRFFDNADFSSNYLGLIPSSYASGSFQPTGPQTVCIAHTVGQFWSGSGTHPNQSRVSSAIFDVFDRSTNLGTSSGSESSESFLTFKVTRYLKPSGGSNTFTEFGGSCTVQILNYNNQNPFFTSPRFTKVTAEVAEIRVYATTQYVSQYVCNILLQREMEVNPTGNKDYNTKIEVRCRDNMLLQREESLASDQQAYFLLSPHRNFEPDASFNGQPITAGSGSWKHEVNLQDGTTFSNWGNLKSYELTCGGGGINANGQSVDNVSVVRGSNNSNRVELNTANIDIETDTSGDIRFGLATWTSGGYAPRFECGNANLGELNMGAPQGSGNYKNAITNVVDICGTSGANPLPLTIKSFNSSKPIVVSTHPTYDGYFNGWTSKNIIIRSDENWGIDIGAGFRSSNPLVGTTAAAEEVLIRTGNNDPPFKYSFLNNVFDVYGNNITGVNTLDASTVNVISMNPSVSTDLEIGNANSRTEMKGAFNMLADASANLTSALSQTGDIAFDTTNNVIKYHDNSGVVAITPSRYYGAAVCDSYPTSATDLTINFATHRYFDGTLQLYGNAMTGSGTNNQMLYMVPQRSRLIGCHVSLGYVQLKYTRANSGITSQTIRLRINHAVLKRTSPWTTVPLPFNAGNTATEAIVPIEIEGYATTYVPQASHRVLLKSTEVIFPTPYEVDAGTELELRCGLQSNVGANPKFEIVQGGPNVSGWNSGQSGGGTGWLSNVTLNFSPGANSNSVLDGYGHARYILETI